MLTDDDVYITVKQHTQTSIVVGFIQTTVGTDSMTFRVM